MRGKGWTVEDEQGLQKWINEQVAADPQGWIAETVKTTTAADGSFQLYWRGLYGQAWDRQGTVPANKFHTLAPSRDEGTFINGNHTSKHVNMDWSYVQVLDKEGNPLPNNVGMMYPWSLGQWAGPDSGNNVELFGGDGVEINKLDDKYLRWNIALYPAPLKFDVLEKNTYDNWARVGETIQTETTGLPIGEGLDYYIQWTDKNGNKVGECGPTAPGADTRIPSCPLTVPADVEHGDTFTARLYQGKDANGQLLAQDAFAVTTSYLEYPDTDAKIGEEATANPVFDNPETNAVEPKLETAEFSIDESNLPEGVTADQVKVDPKTGVVTFTPKAGQENKSFDIPVKMVDTAIQVPVYDENGEQKKGEDGQPLTKPRVISNATAKFNVKEATKTADSVDPKYDNKLVVPGTPAKSEPKFVKQGTEDSAEKPEGATFAIPGDYTAPAGYKVSVDPQTGVVTVEAPEKPNADTTEEFEVPVEVTYKDGSKDKVTAPFQLDTDGDGNPDVKDDDDDNDGVPDAEEKDKGTNPKDPKDKPADKTTVEGTPKPVDPTNDEQGTGIVVKNPNKDGSTKVTAKDEDGKDIPVTVDPETGEVKVTPGTDVDGPITVTIEDEDLPGGKVETEVPVNGHEKGRDDNGSDKTTVDNSKVTPVNPTDEKQGTGIIVTNPDKDTKVTAKDEDGKDVPVVIKPETGEVEVTPGTDVDGPITVIVEDPELPGGKVETEVPVNGHEKGRDDNKKPAGSSDGIDVQKCVATGLGLGIPFLALVPLALGQELNIPGVKEANARIQQQIQDANTALQQRAGIFNPQLAQWVENLNNTLKSPQVQRGLRLAGLLAYGLVAGLTIADQCMPAEKQSSQKTDLFGSLSSKKDEPKDNASSKKDQPQGNGSSKEAPATDAPATEAPATTENTPSAEQPTEEAVQPEASATDTTADATGEEA